MELENSVIPKVEREEPSTLHINEKSLPCIKEWEVGDQYIIKLGVKMQGKNQGSMYDPNDKKIVWAQFVVTGAEEVEMDKKEPTMRKESKSPFMRELYNLLEKHMES